MEDQKRENFYLELTAPQQPQEEQERAQIPALTVNQPPLHNAYAPPPAQPQAEAAQPAQPSQPVFAPPYMAPAQPPQPLYAPPPPGQSAYAQAPPPQPAPPPAQPRPAMTFTPAYAPAGRHGKRKKSSGSFGFSRGAVLAMMLCCLIFSSALGFGGGWLAANFNQPVETLPPYMSASGDLSQSENFAAYLAERMAAWPESTALSPAQVAALTADSVVEIVTQTEVPGFNFWGFSGGSRIQEGGGSGVIIAENGYIITNNHVIENAQKIDVTLRNGQHYDAKLIATDAKTDVAVIKIEAGGLTFANLGDSGALVVGEPAIVIGNPLGQLGGTVTSGIISALDRAVGFQEDDGTTKTMNLLQTDASINSGNSGGGLFNQYGELVGIVVAKSTGFSVEGLGFAIPINDVRGVIDDLITYGYARGRIALGVTLIAIPTEQAAARNNLMKPGVYVMRVDAGSNAERGGLKPGDRLISVKGKEVSEPAQVSEIVQSLSVGDSLAITYERDGQTFSATIVMQETVPANVPATRLGI